MYFWHFLRFWGRFYGKIMEKICLKAPQYYSASIWICNFSICLWKRPKTHYFMMSGFSNVAFFSRQIIFIFGDPRLRQIINGHPKSFLKDIIFIHLKIWEINILKYVGKGGVSKNKTGWTISFGNLEYGIKILESQ